MRRTHGMSHTRLHNIWCTIRERCFNPHYHKYALYGERGITLCSEWYSFENFYAWSVSNGYSEKLTIDRIDPNGNYSPMNCRWVTQKVQQNNRTNNRKLTWDGKTQSLVQWSEELNIPYRVLYDRMYRGWSIDRIFTQPVRER